MSADPIKNLWDAVTSANVRAIAERLYPDNLRTYAPPLELDYPCKVCQREESTHEVYDKATRRHLDVCDACDSWTIGLRLA